MRTPVRAAAELRRIAARIDLSKRPDRALVQADLRRVVHALTREDRLRNVAAEIVRIAQDDVEVDLDLSSWDTQAGKDVDSAYSMAKKQMEDEKLVPALRSLKGDIDSLIEEIRAPGSGGGNESDVDTSAPRRSEIK